MGFRCWMGGLLSNPRNSWVCPGLCGDHVHEIFDDDERTGHRSRLRMSTQEQQSSSLEDLFRELFYLHDLNGNGLLEELELVKLNEKIAMLHHGMETDRNAVKQKYQGL